MPYLERSVDRLLRSLLPELPALMIVGPRATGKTTTAKRHAAHVVRLDDPSASAAFRADPDVALAGLPEPVLLDEWQVVPEVLGAVKRAVDTDPRPGRYLLTGSVRASFDSPTWPGTGRVVRIPMYGLRVAERIGTPNVEPLLDRLANGDALVEPRDPPDLRGYIDLALQSGFPEAALTDSEPARRRWLESYVDHVVTRDAPELEARDPARLRRYFEAFALNTAGVVEDKTLFEAAGVNRKTAAAYERLLVNLMLAERLPAWTSNRLKRLVRAPKRYVIDAALIAGVLGVGSEAILRDGDLLGRLLDTFVAAELRAETDIAATRPRLFHLRTEQGRHEVDLIAERGVGDVVAVEVKAHAAPDRDAAKHLRWLRDELGRRFTRGVVLHTGPRVYQLDDRIIAAPIAVLWTGPDLDPGAAVAKGSSGDA